MKLRSTLLTWLLVLLLALPLSAAPLGDLELYQSKHGVFYQIFVRSFADGDGDGLGDLQGIIQRLDYLNDGDPTTTTDLGVTGIWLTPIHPSPTYHKYDVVDYYSIDPEIGTLEDFRELVAEAHSRGMKVILDLVFNHTSSQHPWFLSARQGPDSPYRDYYVWAQEGTNLTRRGPWNQQVWHPAGDSHYYGLFWGEMPDLNLANPEVKEEVKRIAQFWLEQGVDGFRLDAAKHLFEYDPSHSAVKWWQEFRAYLLDLKPDIYLVGEVWDSPHVVAPYYSAFDSCFNFDLASKIEPIVRFGLDTGLVEAVLKQRESYRQVAPEGLFIDAPFLSNHDQDRIMSRLFGNWEQAKTAASIYLTLPGNPFIYAGEEIGMQGRGDHENIREPFKWYEVEGPGQTTWRSLTFNVGRWQPSVESQDQDPNSLLNHYRRLIQLRLLEPALKYGELVPAGGEANPRVLAYGREWEGSRVLVLHNISRLEQTVSISAEEWPLEEVLFTQGAAEVMREEGSYLVNLAPYSTLIWK